MIAAVAHASDSSTAPCGAEHFGAEGRRIVSYAGLALSLLLVSATTCPGDAAHFDGARHRAHHAVGVQT